MSHVIARYGGEHLRLLPYLRRPSPSCSSSYTTVIAKSEVYGWSWSGSSNLRRRTLFLAGLTSASLGACHARHLPAARLESPREALTSPASEDDHYAFFGLLIRLRPAPLRRSWHRIWTEVANSGLRRSRSPADANCRWVPSRGLKTHTLNVMVSCVAISFRDILHSTQV